MHFCLAARDMAPAGGQRSARGGDSRGGGLSLHRRTAAQAQAKGAPAVAVVSTRNRRLLYPPAKKSSPRGRKRPDSLQPRKRNVFFVITSSPGTFYGGSCGIALNSTTRRHPRLGFMLGLVSGSRGPTQIHIRGLCHWAVSRRATSAPSHRADEPPGPQAPGKQARFFRTGSEGCPRRTT